MKKHLLKFIATTALVLIPFMALTNASYRDSEENSNYFGAGVLDLELKNTDSTDIAGNFFEGKLQTEKDLVKKLKAENAGSVDLVYWPMYEYKSGEEDVCSALDLTLKRGSDEVYNGKLEDLDLATKSATLNPASEDAWEFSLSHENENTSLQGESCDFDIAFKAYQDSSLIGFSDTEKLSNNISLAYEPILTLGHNILEHLFWFKLQNLQNFVSFHYEYTYDTDLITDGGDETVILTNETQKTIEKLLGTCSPLEKIVCVYQENPHNFQLTIDLTDIDGHIINLSENL